MGKSLDILEKEWRFNLQSGSDPHAESSLPRGLSLLLTQKFFHPLDDVAWLRNGLLGQGFELLAVIWIGLKFSCFDIGEKRWIIHGFTKSIAQNF